MASLGFQLDSDLALSPRAAAKISDGSQYYVLLIITDGVISDMTQTKEAIVSVSPRRRAWQGGITVNKCEGVEILPYLQAKELTASFMDTGRRHKIPGSETKDLVIPSNSSNLGFSLCSDYLSPDSQKMM